MTLSISKKILHVSSLSMMVLCLITQAGFSQRSDYEALSRRNNVPKIYINTFTLPGSNASTLQLSTTFHLDYNFLPFHKDGTKPGYTFSSIAALNIEVFDAPKKDLKRNDQVKVSGLKSIGRSAWKDTAYATNYKQTHSKKNALNGSLQVKVKPGFYTYLLQLDINDQGKSRNSRTRNIHIMPYDKQDNGDVILASKIDKEVSPSHLSLINMGNNVIYGKDFYALIHLPQYNAQKTYTLQVNRVKMVKRDTTHIEKMLQEKIKPNQVHSNIFPSLTSNAQGVSLDLKSSSQGFSYALVSIPNHAYPDAVYKLTVKENGDQKTVAQKVFRSLWPDIPTSLLSLDVSIDMLNFIADKDVVKKINSGSDIEREKKFRAFWKQKDPTTNTEYNELEAEFYKRIDYAYDNFSSEKIPGYKTDQGQIYIKYGPPDSKHRTYPADGATTEIWNYGSKHFIFKATSGFGDFVLVSKEH